MAESERPLLVTVIAVLYLLLGLVLVAGGVSLFIGGEMVLEEELTWLAGAGGAVVAAAGLVAIVVSAGFFRGWRLWWYLGVILAVIGILFSIASALMGGYASVAVLIVLAVMLWYLFRDNVKAFFLD